MDVIHHRIYSSKFAVNVLDLSHIELATEEDKSWSLDFWAKLFKTKTWEEMKMIAKDNEYFTEASIRYVISMLISMCEKDAGIERIMN